MGMAIVKSGEVIEDKDQFVRGVDLKNVASVGLDSKSQYVYVFHRDGRKWTDKTFKDKNGERIWNGGDVLTRDTILVVDAHSGQEVTRFGNDFFLMPHGIHLDKSGKYTTGVDFFH